MTKLKSIKLNPPIIALISLVVMLCIILLITVFQGINSFAVKWFGFLGISDRGNVWFLLVIIFSAGTYILLTRPKTLNQAAKVILYAFVQIIFLLKVYYGLLTIYLVKSTGMDPGVILFLQTVSIIVVVGIIYYSSLYLFEEEPMAWKSYALISVFGPILIACLMYFQPYNFFAHEVLSPKSIENVAGTDNMNVVYNKGNKESFKFKKIKDYLVLTNPKDSSQAYLKDEGNLVKIKYWILREKLKNEKDDYYEGKIIDLAYSPGASKVYGLMMRPGTPADAEEAKKFLDNNSKIPYVYDEWQKEEKLKISQVNWKEIYRKEFVGLGNKSGDDPANDGSIYTALDGKDISANDRITVIDTDFEMWYCGKWKKFPVNHWILVKGIEPGNSQTFRHKKGKKFTVVVQRKQV